MSSPLEQFIRDHREEFDADEPAKKVWDKVQQQLEPNKKQEPPVVRLNFMRWSAAAAVILLVGAGAWYFIRTNNNHTPAVAEAKPGTVTPGKNSLAVTADSPKTELAQTDPGSEVKNEGGGTDDEYKEEMYHYARLAEIKHNQLKKIEKDDPQLYRQFSGEIQKLDSVYQNLKVQLPSNPNKELLLQAMVQNLKYQIELLNQQLDIIHKINQAKKADHETNYKTI